LEEAVVPLSLESVREQLLRAGIAPRHVSRYVLELREHLADLTERERRAGLDAKAAGERARDLLGSDAQLVQAMLDKTPRSMAVRAPWAVFTLLPVVALLLAIVLIDVGMYHLLSPTQASAPAAALNPFGWLVAPVSFTTGYLLGPLLVAACIALALRQRLASRWIWIGLGLIALISGLFGFYVHHLPALNGQPPGTAYGALPVVFVDGHVSGAATLSLVAVRAAVLFAIGALVFSSLRTRFAAHP
jgi:hypothetical protein